MIVTQLKNQFIKASRSCGNKFKAVPSLTNNSHSFFSRPVPSNPREIVQRLDHLTTTILAANWADYITLVQNLSFWEAELNTLESRCLLLAADDRQLTEKLIEAETAMDCLIRSTDVEDHLVELMEHSGRHAGIAGTGINAFDGVDNLKEQAEVIGKEYEALLKAYPQYRPKIDETVGHHIAILRQKCRFAFPNQHNFSF